MRAAIYTRISSDPSGRRAGVTRQERECRAFCERNGWEVAGTYTDNDKSAYSGRRRPAYEELLTDLEGGKVDALVAWHPDRVHRSPTELERFISVVEQAGAAVATVEGGQYDLSTASGRMTARVVGAVARHESEHKSERLRAKHRELARLGKVGGGGTRPYGFEADRKTIRPDEAKRIREATAALLAGASTRSILTEWNRAGVFTSTGREWVPISFTRMVTSPRIAGLREHQGAVVGPAEWPAIIDPADHFALVAIFTDPKRKSARRNRRYLLTGGLAVCGLCGAGLVARPKDDGRRGYVCAAGVGFSGCGKIGALADTLEEYVASSVFAALAGPGLAEALAEAANSQGEDGTGETLAEIARLEESLEQAARDHFADRIIGRSEYLAARQAIEDKLDGLRGRLVAATETRRAVNLPSTEDGLRALWDSQDTAWRRQLVELVVSKVTVNPAVKGRPRFDPDRIFIEWKV